MARSREQRAAARRAAAGSSEQPAASMSAKTGVAPSRAIEPPVAKKVKAGQSTWSPGPTPRAWSASSSASDPDLQPTARRASQ